MSRLRVSSIVIGLSISTRRYTDSDPIPDFQESLVDGKVGT